MLAEVGLTGRHRWKRTSLWLDYRGHFRSYVNTANLDTTDQFLTLGLVHQQSRRVQFIVRESGGTYTRNYYMLNGSSFLNPYLPELPPTDFLDNRINYISTAADVVVQKSVRLSFDFGGQGFLIRRVGNALLWRDRLNRHGRYGLPVESLYHYRRGLPVYPL
jgi:hypothetical protein